MTALHELETEHGEISICALFQREHPLELWDLVVAAKWLRSAELDSLKIICSKIQEGLKEKQILKLSHVEILDYDDPVVSYLRENYEVLKGRSEQAIDCNELSERLHFTINRAYLLRCL